MAVYVGDKRYAPYVGGTRRKAEGIVDDPYKGYTLIFHLDGNDNLQDGYWVDKVMGTKWAASGSPSHTNDGGWDVSYNNHFYITPSANTSGLYLPRYYKIEMTFKYASNGWLIDFGSVGNAQKALGILSRDSSGKYVDNYKLLGNGNTRYGVSSNSNKLSINIGEKYTFVYGCVEYNETNDIQFVQNGDTVIESLNPHTQVSVATGAWETDNVWNRFCIGRSSNSSQYAGSGVVYDIKIYGKI